MDKSAELNAQTEELELGNRLMEEQAGIDHLTGLLNRRGFEHFLDRAFERARATIGKRAQDRDGAESDHQPGKFALITFDLDFFKQANDTFGHSAGDQILRQVGRVTRERLRSGDAVARVGGEEFSIIALDANGSAAALAESLRKLIEEETFVITDNEGRSRITNITISLGVAPFHEEKDILLRNADKALYAAKGKNRNGNDNRNQVWVWDEESSAPVRFGA